MVTQTLEVFDLDGTFNEISLEKPSREFRQYFVAVAHYVHEKIKRIGVDDALESITRIAKEQVYPKRSQAQYWAEFETEQGNSVRICPAVDQYLLAAAAVPIYVQEELELTGEDVDAFFKGNWKNKMHKNCNGRSAIYAAINEDGKAALDARLGKNALILVLTNSSTEKATLMLQNAGFGSYIVHNMGDMEPGKIGVIGNGRKYLVDETWGGPAMDDYKPLMDLSEVFEGQDIKLDLRRRVFHKTITRVMEETGAGNVWMVSDLFGLDLAPLKSWKNLHPTVAMKRNPTSSVESVKAAVTLLNAQVSDSLEQLVSIL